MLSLSSFAGMKESTEASPDCNVQDESDMFPQTTSAFTAQSTRRVKRRTSNVPPPFNVEKKAHMMIVVMMIQLHHIRLTH